jgi:predicted DsbA family dithiol-disulfide isomerase
LLRPDAPGSGHDIAEMLRKRTGHAPKEFAQTTSDARHAAEQGLRGVAFFIFNKKLAVSGAQPEETLLQTLNEAA